MSIRIRKEQRVRFYWLLLGILGVWRTTHLLHAEDGPWNLLDKLRALMGRTLLGQLFDCFYCLSLWIAAPFALAYGRRVEGAPAALAGALRGGDLAGARFSQRPGSATGNLF